jgi:hypothetical protein
MDQDDTKGLFSYHTFFCRERKQGSNLWIKMTQKGCFRTIPFFVEKEDKEAIYGSR